MYTPRDVKIPRRGAIEEWPLANQPQLPPRTSCPVTIFGPLRDPDDVGDNIELESISLENSRSSTSHRQPQEMPPTHANDLESQNQNNKARGSCLTRFASCLSSPRKRKSNNRGRKCDMDMCIDISIITKNSFCALLAAGMMVLAITLVILVINNIPNIDDLIKKLRQIAVGLGPH